MEAKIPCCGLAKRWAMLKMYRSKVKELAVREGNN